MPESRLSPLQRNLLRLLASLEPRGTLTGGAALVGFYTFHRVTKDLDLFWHGRSRLEDIPDRAVEAVRHVGLPVDRVQASPAFHRLRVTGGEETCLVDLVADPVATIEAPIPVVLGDTELLIDTRHEILVNKLTTLLSRSEVRDLEDVRVLSETGGDLRRALADAPRKDGGFSPLTLAWVLRGFRAGEMARSLGWSDEDARSVEEYRGRLVEQLLREGAPGSAR